MAETAHSSLIAATGAIHPAAYVASSDPGAVGAHKFWVDITGSAPYQLKKRNAADSAWENVGSIASLTDPTNTRGDLIKRGVAVLERLAVGAANTLLGSNGTDPAWTAAPTVSGELTALDLKASGMTGATNSVRLVGGNSSGSPASGTFAVRDVAVDTDGTIWICTVAGSPGTWVQVSGTGGGGGGAGFGITVPDVFQQAKITDTTSKTTTSTSFVVIDNTNLPAKSLSLLVGDVVRCQLVGQTVNSGANGNAFDFNVVQPTLGTVRTAATAGFGAAVAVGTTRTTVNAESTFTATEAGTHTFQPVWMVSAGTGTLYNGTSGGDDTAILFTAQKVGSTLTQPYVCVQDQKASGTEGGTFTNGAWRTRDLNTELEDTHAIASLSSNQVTLPSGTYRCHILAPGRSVNTHAARLRNITASTTLLSGQSARSTEESNSVIVGRFTLATSSALEVQHICESTGSTNGFGISVGSRVTGGVATEIYTVAEFWKEA